MVNTYKNNIFITFAYLLHGSVINKHTPILKKKRSSKQRCKCKWVNKTKKIKLKHNDYEKNTTCNRNKITIKNILLPV